MKLRQIKPANKNTDPTNRIVLAYPIFQAFRKQRDLLAIHSLDGLGQSHSHLPESFCVRSGGNGSQRVIALKSLNRGKRILATRGGSRSAGGRVGFGDCGRGLRGGGRRQRRIALAAVVDALGLRFGPVEG